MMSRYLKLKKKNHKFFYACVGLYLKNVIVPVTIVYASFNKNSIILPYIIVTLIFILPVIKENYVHLRPVYIILIHEHDLSKTVCKKRTCHSFGR